MDTINENMVYKRINITLPPETYEKLERIAKNDDRPVSNVIKRMIEAHKE